MRFAVDFSVAHTRLPAGTGFWLWVVTGTCQDRPTQTIERSGYAKTMPEADEFARWHATRMTAELTSFGFSVNNPSW